MKKRWGGPALWMAPAGVGVGFGCWWLCGVAFPGSVAAALAARLALAGVGAAGFYAWRCRRSAKALETERARALAVKADGDRLAQTAIETLVYAIEARVTHNLGHSARVRAYSRAVGVEMGLGADAVDALSMAALMHDIGRLAVPSSILTKGSSLTDREIARVRAYPVLSSRMVAAIALPWPIAPVVRHHREHFDGTGYPDGVAGAQIPQASRIIAVADAFDAMISPRADRPGRPAEDALEALRRDAGAQYDPAVVEAFARALPSAAWVRDNAPGAGLGDTEGAGPMPSAALEIARAQMEMQGLFELACDVGGTIDRDEALEAVADRIQSIIPCSTCVVYLLASDGLTLAAAISRGVNAAHFAGSNARVGVYLTGRAVSRCEPALASFMMEDVTLTFSSATWRPLRSTLIAPLRVGERAIGTINVYSIYPDAFDADDVRTMLAVGEVAGRAVQNALAFHETQETAYTDGMTGLRNARYLMRFLDREINRSDKRGRTFGLLGLDLDKFKMVNDTLGHARGDQLLRDIAHTFRAQVRNYDLVCRYAGDEFVIVLPDCDRASAEVVMAKIRRAVNRYADTLRRNEPGFPGIGVSLGLAMYPENGEDASALMSYADQGMYADKRESRAA